MIRNITIYSMLFIFFFLNSLNAQTTSIPDAEFEQYLIDSNIDSDGTINQQVLTNDILGVTNLSINNYNISNLEGLQNFSSLTNFTMINNFATVINLIDFSENSQLLEINIVNASNLAQIDVSQNLQLTHLQVFTQGTLFNSIDVSNNINLINLIIVGNAITSLDTKNNTQLTYLNVNDNPITELDVSHLNSLQTLATFATEIEELNLSNNNNLTVLLAENGLLKRINLKNNSNRSITYLDLRNNPNLTCILVDDANYSETATDWYKDSTASYIEESIVIETEPQDIPIQYDSAGNYKTAIDEWLINNGGAVATSVCGEISWSYNIFEFFIQRSTSKIVYGVEFLATDIFGNTNSMVLDLTVENINHFDTDIYGTGDTVCDDIFDFNTVITDIQPNASLKLPDVENFSFKRVSNFEDNEGPLGVSFIGTKGDFPDTGAGSYSYLFEVSIDKKITVYDQKNNVFESEIIEENASITINDKTVAFDVEELDDITVAPGEITSIQYLTDLLVITPDPDVLEPQNPINLNQYWTPSVYSGSGTYTFDPTDAFPDCPSNPVSITVTESTLSVYENELLKQISIYPNPTKDMLYLNGEIFMLDNIEIYAATGQKIMTVTEISEEIDVSTLKSALYFIKLHTENATKVIKMIKK